MVALGNNRNNGAALGAFYLNAANDLGNSNGNNWRGRYTNFANKQEVKDSATMHSSTQSNEARASHTTQSAVADGAVKALHTSAVSRTAVLRRFGDCGQERWMRHAA